MNLIYLDSNILIALHSRDKAEEEKRRQAQGALSALRQLRDVSLCTSMWAITEMVNILLSSKRMEPMEVFGHRGKPA